MSYFGHLGYSNDLRHPGYRLKAYTGTSWETYGLVLDDRSALTLHHAAVPYPMTRPQFDALWEHHQNWRADCASRFPQDIELPATILARATDPAESPTPDGEAIKGIIWVQELFVGNTWEWFFAPPHPGEDWPPQEGAFLKQLYEEAALPALIQLGILPHSTNR